MAQITWRNVNSDMTPYQGRALEGAGRSFDSMFEKLQGVVARTQAIDDKNWENTKTNRTNDALNQIMGYGSPEAMAQAQKAGALEQMLGGGQIDQQAVRAAFDSRMPELQKRVTQGFAYDNAVVDQRTAPMMEAARMQALNKDFAGSKATLMKAQELGARNGSQVAEFSDGRQRLNTTRGYEDQKQVWAGDDQRMQGEKHTSDLLTNQIQREQARNAMANDNSSRRLAQAKFDYDKSKSEKDYGPGGSGTNAAMEKQYEAAKSNSVMSMGAYGTKEGMANLSRELTTRGVSPGQRNDILYNLSKYYSKGVPLTHDKEGKPVDRLALPVAAILEEIDSASDFGFFGVSRKGDATVNALDKRFGIDSNGNKDSDTFTKRDQDLVNEMITMNKWDSERTAGLYREGQNKEIRNVPKGKGKKQK